MRTVFVIAAVVVSVSFARSDAAIVERTVEYRHLEDTLKGYLVYDDAAQGQRPGVLVVHEWWGLNDYAKGRARQLAALGYVAFALDMYGDGRSTREAHEAKSWSGRFYGKPLQHQRALAGLEVLRGHERVAPGKLAVIGYCFGGSTALSLAYSGADVAVAVSFHGNLVLPRPSADIAARILVCHGADDPFVTDDDVRAFQEAMRRLGIDWQLIAYGGARHSFTNPGADRAGIDGVAYDKAADRCSWRHMLMLFEETFAGPK
ncbi:MAG: dienelactone hydrolase [Phycisphaeraceae bacterium]|nr:dienelactone hydrolase [Phycisphaeraceae bacterium]